VEEAREGYLPEPLKAPPLYPFGIPSDYTIETPETGVGIKYCAPLKPNYNSNSVRFMPPNFSSQYSHMHVPYVKDLRDGHYRDINGNIVPSNSSAAHIPYMLYWFNK
jgi:hypothetical protein